LAAKAIVLDLDGTVWDSYAWYAGVLVREGASAQGTLAQLQAGGSIVRIRQNCGVSDSRFRRLCASYACDLPLYPGVRDSLEVLTERGTALGIATSLPGWLVKTLIDGLGLAEYFGSVIHAGNCSGRKPSPTPILAAVRGLGLEVDATVFYVGDRTVDARAAVAAGVTFAWAKYGYGDERPAGTAKVIRHFREVLTL
jgi:HAD superfamily hydrolase (TIGR01549 family)